MAEGSHEHTPHCADASRYVLVEVKVHVLRSGRANARVLMKPGAACWADVSLVHASALEGIPFPDSPAVAAEAAIAALRAAFPGLF